MYLMYGGRILRRKRYENNVGISPEVGRILVFLCFSFSPIQFSRFPRRSWLFLVNSQLERDGLDGCKPKVASIVLDVIGLFPK